MNLEELEKYREEIKHENDYEEYIGLIKEYEKIRNFENKDKVDLDICDVVVSIKWSNELNDELEECIKLLNNILLDSNIKCNVHDCLIKLYSINNTYVALREIDQIINNKIYDNLEVFHQGKINILKEKVKDSDNKELKEIFNKEIMDSYDYLIETSDNKIEYLKQKMDYLIDDKSNKTNIYKFLYSNEFIRSEEIKREYYAKKMYLLNEFNRYEEAKYIYNREIESYFKDKEDKSYYDDCSISYLIALQHLKEHKNIEIELQNKKDILLDSKPFLYFNIAIYTAFIDGNESKLQMYLLDINEYYRRKDEEYYELKLKCLSYLYEINRDKNIEIQINDLYFENLKFLLKNKNSYINYEATSNITTNLIVKAHNDDILYHYTDINALKSILENNELWVTASEFLNDSSETKCIIDYFKGFNDKFEEFRIFLTSKRSEEKEIEQNLKSKGFNRLEEFFEYDEFNKILKRAIHQIENYYFKNREFGDVNYGVDALFNREEDDWDSEDVYLYIKENLKPRLRKTYILSLSKNRDSLILWGNYSNNSGYNIGFKRKELIEQFKQNLYSNEKIYDRVIDGEVNYVDISQKKNMDIKIIKEFYDYYKECKEKNIDEDIIICGIISNIISVGLFTKKKVFSNEEEYRVVIIKEDNKDDSIDMNSFRCKDGAIIPFLKVPFKDESITNIMIGPNNKSDISEEGLRALFEHKRKFYKYDHKKIEEANNEYKDDEDIIKEIILIEKEKNKEIDVEINKSGIPLRY